MTTSTELPVETQPQTDLPAGGRFRRIGGGLSLIVVRRVSVNAHPLAANHRRGVTFRTSCTSGPMPKA